MDSCTVVAVMAHPDDAEAHCGGTLAQLAARGCDVHIVSVTGGQCGTMTHPIDIITSIRRGEAEAAAAVIGATYHGLEEPDGKLMYDRPTLQRCLDLFRELTPSIVITHFPSDYHTDHEVTSKLARTASFLYAAPNASSAPLSPQAKVPYLYYADANDGIDVFGRRIAPSLFIDVSGNLMTIRDMLRRHKSQWEWLASHHGMADFGEAIITHAQSRGAECGVAAAEAFVQHRGHGYPADDRLRELLRVASPPRHSPLITP